MAVNVLQELIKKFGAANVQQAGDKRVKIICPYHKEKTPSMVVNTTEPHLGRAWCFACGANKNFNQLMGGNYIESSESLSLSISDDVLNEDSNPVDKDWVNWPRWDKNKVWRTIPGKTVRKVQGRVENTEYGLRLALPCIQNKRVQGLIHCSFYKSKIAYLYDKHPFINRTLYLYDHAKKMLSKSKTKTLFFVEGPRDALRFTSVGLPTVANLGGITVFNEYKAELLLDLNPNQIIIATDPDEIGEKLAAMVKDSLPGVRKRRLLFDVEYDKKGKVTLKEDPASIDKEKLAKLIRNYS
jgi:DNA primase